ncbi:tetratricopeptide repeat-containing protein [Roseovarius sp. S1116L3]|uniref:tetratricopeptide repeat-containing protein n=1 Tax=Roseovarius roseus TaxID=3342636 RepID=UPI003727C7A6
MPLTWAFKRSDPEWALAQKSGWSRGDLMWERLMEAGCEAFAAGQMARAGRLFFAADALARGRFAEDDLRRAAPLAARALLRQARGKDASALIAEAQRIWQGAPGAIAAMEIKPRIRSSLFHLRMEAKHRGQYQDNLRLRLGRITEETAETLARLGDGPAPHRHFARWRGEKPSVFDGTRKVLSAALLIPDAGR